MFNNNFRTKSGIKSGTSTPIRIYFSEDSMSNKYVTLEIKMERPSSESGQIWTEKSQIKKIDLDREHTMHKMDGKLIQLGKKR